MCIYINMDALKIFLWVVELHHNTLIHFIPLLWLKRMHHFYKQKNIFSLRKYVGICVSWELHERRWEVNSGRVGLRAGEALHHFPRKWYSIAGFLGAPGQWCPGGYWSQCLNSGKRSMLKWWESPWRRWCILNISTWTSNRHLTLNTSIFKFSPPSHFLSSQKMAVLSFGSYTKIS